MRVTQALDVNVYLVTMAAHVTNTIHVTQCPVKMAPPVLTSVNPCIYARAGKVTMETNVRCTILVFM